ncbi:MAG: histidine phosphatase family protein [Bacillota bacterium]|nr:histidine phosphatase family protein [Bacillota bacterium]
MKTQILLVRHGETEWNTSGRFQGCTDISLSEEGIIQAHYIKERFNGDFDCIYASPLKRALKTAEVITKNTEMTPIISNELREINFGKWEGLTLNQIEADYKEEFKLWRNDEINGNLVGGDLSIRNASQRARDEILRIAKENTGKRVIIVAHGGIIKAGLIGVFDWKMTMYHKMILGNTSVSKLVFDEKFNPMLIFLNDLSHLPDEHKAKFFV